jgi:hypothetical protein
MIKTDDPNFVRDEGTNALINTNVKAFKLYKQQRESMTAQAQNEQEINDLKQKLLEMDALIKNLIREKNG